MAELGKIFVEPDNQQKRTSDTRLSEEEVLRRLAIAGIEVVIVHTFAGKQWKSNIP